MSAWAERNRILGRESPFPGRWRNDLVPYLKAPMDAFSDPEVERIVCVFAAQCGKTEIELNCLGYAIDQDPGTSMLVYDSERSADKVMKLRVHPMILASPALRRHLLGGSDALGLKEIELDTAYIFTAWSNSPGALSQAPVRHVFLDEVDKYLPFSGREANPIELAAVRTRNFRGRRKILIGSTPTLETKYVWSEFLRSNQQRYHVPCPRCGRFQMLDFFRGLKWKKDCSVQEIYERNLAWYVCDRCGAEIPDREKPRMLAHGAWVPQGMELADDGSLQGEEPVAHRPSRLLSGFQLPVLYSPFVPWGEVAAKWCVAKGSGDLSLLMDFFNSWLALPWQERVESVTDEKLKAAVRDYPVGVVPREARVLTAGVDVQPEHFWFVIRAWGPGMRSWLVRWGMAFTWPQVLEAIASPYPTESGGSMKVQKALIDSGFKAREVYQFCRENAPLTTAAKGSNNPALVATWRIGRPEPGVPLFTFKVDHFKDQLSTLISAKPGDPGEWALYRGVEDDPYLKHMVSERRVIVRKKGRVYSTWQPLTDSTPNHLFDCEVLCTFAADLLQVRFLGAEESPSPAPAAAAFRDPTRRTDEWLEPDRGWLGDLDLEL